MTPHATSDPCDTVLDEIASVKRAVGAIDVCAYQGASPEALGELSKSLARAHEEARGLGRRLTDLCDEILERTPGRVPIEGPLGERRSPSALDLGDLAFVLCMGLNRNQLELESAKTPALMLDVCERCRHDLELSLAALEQRFQGESSTVPRERGVEASLKCRRAYARLRAGMLEVGDVARGRDNIVRALTTAGALIALLIGSDGYLYFRASDRLQLASLERRVLNYLEHGGSFGRGLRLFEDFKLFVDQLAVINLRQDLRRHDVGCLSHWLSELEGAGSSSVDLMGSVNKYREALQGRDAELDTLLEGQTTLTRLRLIADLRRLLSLLAPGRREFDDHAPPSASTRSSA